MDAFEIVLRYQEENRWFVNESYQFSFHDPAQQNTIAPSELLRTPDRIDPEHLFDEMDKYLEFSLRYAAFWLSIHYYEACWLELAEKSEFIDPEDRWKNTPDIQDKYWNQGPNLTPCFVMTEYQLPKYFLFYHLDTKEKRPDYGRIDLLITDEAGQVNTPVAAAGFSLAKKAIVLGDTKQLSPIWGLDQETDKSTAKEFGVDDKEFSKRQKRGLNCSDPASIMLAAENACKWRHAEDEAGLFLEEHYRCVDGIIEFCNRLSYNGKLKPCREHESPLQEQSDVQKVKPFVLYTVKGSVDKRSGSSRLNVVEGEAVVAWIEENREVLEKLYAPNHIADIIGVVTPFAAQARCIQTLLETKEGNYKDITVGTAHRLQGAERPVILFSATYGDNSADASFVNSTPNLMNVAVSRAKDLFVLFVAEKRRKDKGAVFKCINCYGQDRQITFSTIAENAVQKESEREQASVDEGMTEAELNKPIKEEAETIGMNICPKCGKELRVKNGKYGKFIGCSGFPECKYTEKLK